MWNDLLEGIIMASFDRHGSECFIMRALCKDLKSQAHMILACQSNGFKESQFMSLKDHPSCLFGGVVSELTHQNEIYSQGTMVIPFPLGRYRSILFDRIALQNPESIFDLLEPHLDYEYRSALMLCSNQDVELCNLQQILRDIYTPCMNIITLPVAKGKGGQLPRFFSNLGLCHGSVQLVLTDTDLKKSDFQT